MKLKNVTKEPIKVFLKERFSEETLIQPEEVFEVEDLAEHYKCLSEKGCIEVIEETKKEESKKEIPVPKIEIPKEKPKEETEKETTETIKEDIKLKKTKKKKKKK